MKVSVFFAILIVSAICVIVLMSTSQHSIPQMELKLHQAPRLLGGIIAVSAGFLLLLQAFLGLSVDRMLPTTLPLLGGLLIANAHWSVVIALTTICVAWIVQRMVVRESTPAGSQPTPTEAKIL